MDYLLSNEQSLSSHHKKKNWGKTDHHAPFCPKHGVKRTRNKILAFSIFFAYEFFFKTKAEQYLLTIGYVIISSFFYTYLILDMKYCDLKLSGPFCPVFPYMIYLSSVY